MGHEVIVANPRKVKLITQSVKKNDRMDAEQLARLARVDPKLLSPIHHRGPEAQADLAVVRARMTLVDARTELINSARGLAKPMGERLPKCDADYVKESLADGLSAAAQSAIRPLLKSVEEINKQIQVYEQRIGAIAERYPEMKVLKQVHGVGTLIALTYILTLEDAQRFAHSREVGPYVGLTRKLRESGDSRPELGISKAGDELLRRLLVQGAHCILRQGAPDSDLKAWGMARLGKWQQAGERQQEGQEEGGGGGGPQAGGVAASFVGDGGSLRSALQPQAGSQEQRQSSSLRDKKRIGFLQSMRKRRVGVTASLGQIVGSQETGSLQIDTEMAAPLELRTPTGTAATAASRVRMEAWRQRRGSQPAGNNPKPRERGTNEACLPFPATLWFCIAATRQGYPGGELSLGLDGARPRCEDTSLGRGNGRLCYRGCSTTRLPLVGDEDYLMR